jgi:hypothetical protein
LRPDAGKIPRRYELSNQTPRRIIMLTFTAEAAAFIRARNQSVFLDIPPLIDCCVHLKESPAVRFGEPHDPQNYRRETIAGVVVFVPRDLPDIPLTVTLTSFLGYKRLVVEGWHLA